MRRISCFWEQNRKSKSMVIVVVCVLLHLGTLSLLKHSVLNWTELCTCRMWGWTQLDLGDIRRSCRLECEKRRCEKDGWQMIIKLCRWNDWISQLTRHSIQWKYTFKCKKPCLEITKALNGSTAPWGLVGHVKSYLHVGLYEWEMVHVLVVQGRLCSPDVRVGGPRLAPTFAFCFTPGGTFLQSVPGAG